jgi:hypothetical protein
LLLQVGDLFELNVNLRCKKVNLVRHTALLYAISWLL